MAPRFRVCGNRDASDGLDCHHTKSSGLGGGVPDPGPGCRGLSFGGCGSSAHRSDTGAVGYSSQLLSRLGFESNLAQCADGVCAEATRDRNAAQFLTDQANPAAGSREQRKAVAPRTLNSARIAAAAATARAGSAEKASSARWANPTSGRVIVFSGFHGGYGDLTILDHGNGTDSADAHIIDGGRPESNGRTVTAGQLVTCTGSTGGSMGCHFHFSIRSGGAACDPVPFMRKRRVTLG